MVELRNEAKWQSESNTWHKYTFKKKKKQNTISTVEAPIKNNQAFSK